MITLICTKCKNSLEMDEAFAGGVCRCQYCGTIQTVPSHLKHSGRPATPVASGQKALYGGGGAGGSPGVPSSGLDDLASAVATSSGLTSGGVAQRRPTRGGTTIDYPAPGAGRQPSRTPLFIALGVGGIVIVGLLIWILTRGGSENPNAANQAGGASQNPTGSPTGGGSGGSTVVAPTGIAVPSGPHFLTLSLSGNKVVFLLDRGGATQAVFDPLKYALFQAIESLGPDREFQALGWTAGGLKDDPNAFAYPKGKLAKATADELAKLKDEFEDITAGNTATDINAVLKEAVKRNPDRIIIATGKGLNLDDADVQKVKKARGTKSIVFDTVDLSDGGEGRAILEKIARDTGGTYIHVRPGDLRAR